MIIINSVRIGEQGHAHSIAEVNEFCRHRIKFTSNIMQKGSRQI